MKKNNLVRDFINKWYGCIMVHLAVKKRTIFKSKRKPYIQTKRGIFYISKKVNFSLQEKFS